MRTIGIALKVFSLALLLVAFTGCESTDGGGNVSGGAYYGVGSRVQELVRSRVPSELQNDAARPVDGVRALRHGIHTR